MTTSNFSFLSPEWPDLHATVLHAEGYVRSDARSAIFHARRSLEQVVAWMYENDPEFTPRPYDDNLNALLRAAPFVRLVPLPVQQHADLVRREGNAAVHGGRPVTEAQALGVVRDLWLVLRWFAFAYREDDTSPLPTSFDETLVPPARDTVERLTRGQLQALQERLAQEEVERTRLRQEIEGYETKLRALQASVSERKARHARLHDPLHYDEAATRARIIDVLLREAGWEPDAERVREFPVSGIPTRSGGTTTGRVDYVLWGADGLPLAVVEAKKTSVDAQNGRQQASLYADALERQYGRRPVIFYTNGTTTYLWDDRAFGAAGGYPPRPVWGFLTRDELELTVRRRTSRLALGDQALAPGIAGRPYQERAIRAWTEHLTARHRRGLLVMATGTGKTRTAVSLVEVLQRAGWVKRVLFLADRTVLVDQAARAFKTLLPGGSVANLLTERTEARTARVVVSTYQTMMGMIESERLETGERVFGPGHFDLVIVDEAHRSIYRSYGALLSYFDAYLLGLTATPRDEVDRNTYTLFEMEEGVPLFSYDLDEAVRDKYLVPPNGVDATPNFLRRGITYDELSEEAKEEWDAIDWDERGGRRDAISATEVNKWLFNQDTVDKVLKHLMQEGVRIEGGDSLGKTIIFAANHDHALYIVKRFEAHYPMLSDFARVIDSHDRYAHTLLDKFSRAGSGLNIAVSVDMLDTGVDVPEVVNLVLFKVVRSRTKFWQMLGRGTRLRPDLFGPGEDKDSFNVLDYCDNFRFFRANPGGVKTSVTEPVSQRTFKARLDLLRTLGRLRESSEDARELYATVADDLHARVAGMPLENFIVRPHREVIEKYLSRERWDHLTGLDLVDLARSVSGLPTSVQDGEETARRFDELIVRLQLARLRGAGEGARLQTRVQDFARALSGKTSIPDVAQHAALLTRLQQDETWEEMTPQGLETVRTRLRGLLGVLDREDRAPVYTNWADAIEGTETVSLPQIAGGINVVQYRKKVEGFLQGLAADPVIDKVRKAVPLGEADLAYLEHLLFSAGEVQSREVFERVYGEQTDLPGFIRSLVGLDRAAAKAAFGKYLDGQVFSHTQVQFVERVIELLTRSGHLNPGRLFEAPFTDAHPSGITGVFPEHQAMDIVSILKGLNTGRSASA